MNDRIVALVDMDCFYCQVETRLNESLKGVPMAVVQYNQWKGGGIIAVNYEARERGVTRHMRGDEARKHCPEIQLVSVPSVRGKADLTKYRDAGREVINVICEFSEVVQRASVDEAYIDLTEAVVQRLEKQAKVTTAQLENTFVVGYSCENNNDEEERKLGVATWLDELYGKSSSLHDDVLHRLATATALVEEMRATIYDRTGFRCSAGIAHNKILAKLVAGLHKPNRQTVLPPISVPLLYSTLPLKRVRNLGGKLGDDVVEKLGITYMSELASFTEKQLQACYDEKTASWLYNIARGIDLDPVTPRLVSKSIGCCKKFPGITALRTKANVTHWLSELAAEVAERLDEDVHMNKRKAQLLTIHFSQEINSKDVSMSRSVPFPGYESEKIAVCAFNVLSKQNSASHSSDEWYPPLKYLGLSAGKFVDYSGNSLGSIDKFFKAKPSTSKSNAELTSRNTVNSGQTNDEIISNKCDQSLNKEIIRNGKPDRKVSFFEKYFMNQPNKLIKNSPIKDNILQENIQMSGIKHDDKVFVNSKLNIENEKASDNSGDSWISPSEIFPDLDEIDDSVLDILPSPIQRKICKLRGTKKIKKKSSNLKESDSDLSREETLVNIHPLQEVEQITSTSSVCLVVNKDVIESEDSFDQTTPDLFALEANEKLRLVKDSDMCTYCKKIIPMNELQEHLDHHVALMLQEQWNKEPETERSVSKETKPNKPVLTVNGKKKRGRPSKKDIEPPKKLKTIASFFTKS